MDKSTFEGFRKIVYEESGIVLTPEKLPLLSSRIQKRITALGLRGESEYLQIIESDMTGKELIQLIDVVSTNVTYFYRESAHFQIYRTLLSKWAKEGKENFKVWCAAASSGEEPYTLAFEACEVLDGRRHTLKILGTDICTEVLNEAIHGIYKTSDIEKIPSAIRNKYLTRQYHNGEEMWKVTPEISQMLLFKKLNLVQFPYPLKGPMDVIFCRNVMIYFDIATRAKIIKQCESLLAPGGHLFLSHSENLLGITHGLTKVGPSVFRKG